MRSSVIFPQSSFSATVSPLSFPTLPHPVPLTVSHCALAMLSQTQHTPAQSCPLLSSSPNILKYFHLFIWFCWVLAVICRIFDLHCGIQDLSLWHVRSRDGLPTRDGTHVPHNQGAQSLGHWTIKQVPPLRYYPSPPYLFTESGCLIHLSRFHSHVTCHTISCLCHQCRSGSCLLMVISDVLERCQSMVFTSTDSEPEGLLVSQLTAVPGWISTSEIHLLLQPQMTLFRHRITADVIS